MTSASATAKFAGRHQEPGAGFCICFCEGLFPRSFFSASTIRVRLAEMHGKQSCVEQAGKWSFEEESIPEERRRGALFEVHMSYFVRMQGFVLASIDTPMAKLRKEFVEGCLPEGLDCIGLCERILANLGAWPTAQTRKALEDGLTKLRSKAKTDKDSKCRRRVAYLVLDQVGRRGLETLLSE